MLQDLTASDAAAQDAVDGITLCDGGDQPEAQLNALCAELRPQALELAEGLGVPAAWLPGSGARWRVQRVRAAAPARA